ncbi:hypothetical protein [Parasphingopyxis sp.]|uniref:terminase small subunit-like protein n=1 Tax=Parasphingopyxis sp. TaxID=1920299 RepID=UPI00262DAED0|nr:hypothetical protein [Parasphingopyxis sp.]
MPRVFEDDQIQELLDRTEKGESLTSITADSRMPGRTTVYNWQDSDPDFSERFRVARARGVHALAEECLEIADTAKPEDVAVARVRIDTRLRLAGKWLPKIYGNSVDVKHSGEIRNRHDLSRHTADELDALERLVAKGSDAEGDKSGEGQAGSDTVH